MSEQTKFPPEHENAKAVPRPEQRESIRAALALLLGPKTDYHLRVRATRRLAKQGPAILPFLLTTLSAYPEITTPTWPWWPPQYEHCSRLLIHLSQQVHMRLDALLLHPAVPQPCGPVLWTSVIEAAGLLPHEEYEELLCQGLEMSWATVRYAAAMALAMRAQKVPLHPSTHDLLHAHQGENETYPVRLTASYALLNCREQVGLEALIHFLDARVPEEVRKASAFILANELPFQLSGLQRERLASHLLNALQDSNPELALHTAHALGKIAWPALLPSLYSLLESDSTQTQIMLLTALEEMARRESMRRTMLQHALPTRILPFMKSAIPEMRRQASYTLAVCGGEYVTAALGTMLLHSNHPGHLEAIEGLRLLHGALRMPTRMNVVRWLLQILSQSSQPSEERQITAIDSLVYLLWQAHVQGQKQAWIDISQELLCEGTITKLLQHQSAWIRQRTIELLSILGGQLDALPDIHKQLLHLLLTDSDSGVRACAAYVCGELGARWAIPTLLQALLDPDEYVAITTLNSLSRLANVDDAVVVYVLTEIAHAYSLHQPITYQLAQQAQSLLKKWRKFSPQAEAQKQLRSS